MIDSNHLREVVTTLINPHNQCLKMEVLTSARFSLLDLQLMSSFQRGCFLSCSSISFVSLAHAFFGW